MLRPESFTKPHRTTIVTPYQMISSPSDMPERGSSNGGVFHRGQIVWTQDAPAVITPQHTTIGFVDGLGHVLVDPRVLRLTETIPPSQN